MRLLLPVLALLVAASAHAQPVRPADVVSWRVRAERAAPGQESRVVFDAEIAPGWRLYAADSPVGRPFAVDLDPLPGGVTALALRQAPPRRAYDAAFETDYTYFAERARFVQPLRVGRAVRPGERTVSGALRYAVCDDEVCLPPARLVFTVPLVVE